MTATLTEKDEKAKTKLKPLGNNVVLKKKQAEEKSDGGIFLPGGSQEKPLEAIVISVGPGLANDKGERSPLEVKPGDEVLFSKYSGTDLKYAGEEYLIVSEKDILAVIAS